MMNENELSRVIVNTADKLQQSANEKWYYPNSKWTLISASLRTITLFSP